MKKINLVAWPLLFVQRTAATGGLFLLILNSSFALPTLQDPTRPPNFDNTPNNTATNNGQLFLSAIFIYPNTQMAIINAQMVRQGDRLGEFTVTLITANTVELISAQNRRETLQLATTIKEPVN